MEEIYRWAGTIVSYLVFVTVLTVLLPSARYEKYLRLFAGCVLILLVFQPLTNKLRLEESIHHLFRSISFENEAAELAGQSSGQSYSRMEGQLAQELGALEEKRLELLISEYEEEAEKEIKRLAEAFGLPAAAAEVTVERNPECPDFAEIKSVRLAVVPAEPDKAGAEKTYVPGDESKYKKEPVTDAGVHIDAVASVEVKTALSPEAEEAAGLPEQKHTFEDDEKIRQLKQQIAAYYQVEDAYVEVKVED